MNQAQTIQIPLSPQNIADVVATISHERLSAYRAVTADDASALELYQANTELSKQVYELIGGFEIALRNVMVEAIVQHYSRKDWYRARKAFTIHLSKDRRDNLKETRKRLTDRNKVVNSGSVTAGMSFHFWASLHEGRYRDVLWTPFLRKVWPASSDLKKVHRNLLAIRDLRNRVAHYEPIFAPKWRNKIDKVWERFDQIAPEKAGWYRARLEAKINTLCAECSLYAP